MERKHDKVVIVGCSDSKSETPWDDKDCEFWGVNNLFLTLPDKPWSRWFEIHPFECKNNLYSRRWKYDFRGQKVNDYIAGLGKLKCPVYMQQKWDIVPTSTEYPIKDITEDFGRYFTNTISYEIALAIYMQFKEIGIYGVDMAVDSEYHHQRPSCEFFLGIALGKGININIPDEADLVKTRFLYGYEEKQEDAWMKKVKNQAMSMQQRMVKSQQVVMNEQRKVDQYTGAISACNEQIKIWKSL